MGFSLSSVSSALPRVLYGTIFVVGIAIAWILRDLGPQLLKHVAIWNKECGDDRCYGKQGVLRASWTLFMFFLPLCLLMTFGGRCFPSWCNSIQNRWWIVKVPVVLALFVISLLLPNWMLVWYGYAALIGAFFFIFIQVVLLVNLAHQWNEDWVGKEWYKQIIAVASVMYAASAAAIVIMFIWFAPGCPLNTFFICFTLVSSVVYTYISIREDVERGALLTSAVVTVFCTYLCFSAMLGETTTGCNPFPPNGDTATWMLVVGVLIAMASIAWSALRSATYKGFFELDAKDQESTPLVDGEGDVEAPLYSYSFFHFVFSCGAMYMAMLFLSWNLSGAQKVMYVEIGQTSMWVKMVSQWITIALYIWSLVGPLVFPNRDWGLE